jgi:hypothetical protein
MRSTIPGTADGHESEMIFNKAAAAMGADSPSVAT